MGCLRLRGAVDKAMIHSSHSHSCLLLQKEEDEGTEGL